MEMTPDERQYAHLAKIARERGLRATAEHAYPGVPTPARWLWVWWVSLFRDPMLASKWVGFCTVGEWCSKRLLQDGAVEVAAVAACVATTGPWWGLAVAIAAMLSLKEAAILFLPGLLVLGEFRPEVAIGLGSGVALWLLAGAAVFGPRTWARLLGGAVSGHDHDYGREHQRCHPALFLGMTFSVAPLLAVGSGPAHWAALVIAGTVAVSPVRNLRMLGPVQFLAFMGAINGRTVQFAIAIGAFSCLWHLWLVSKLTRPGKIGEWKDSRGTVDLVPAAVLAALRR